MKKIESLALDASAIIDLLRPDLTDPPYVADARRLYIPLTAFGELLAGAYGSNRTTENVTRIEEFVAAHKVLLPSAETARIYGRLRAALRGEVVKHRKINDLWIAAVCIEHDLPLLTSDDGFDTIAGLEVLHW